MEYDNTLYLEKSTNWVMDLTPAETVKKERVYMETIQPLSFYIKFIILSSFLTIVVESISETCFADEKLLKEAWKDSNIFLKVTNFYILKYKGVLLIPCISMIILWHALNILSIISLFCYPKSLFLLDKLIKCYIVLMVIGFLGIALIPYCKEKKVHKKREQGKELTKEEKRKHKEKKKRRKSKR